MVYVQSSAIFSTSTRMCARAYSLVSWTVQCHIAEEADYISTTIQMAVQGSSRSNPIYLSDISPVSVPVSPVKPLREKEKKDQCR